MRSLFIVGLLILTFACTNHDQHVISSGHEEPTQEEIQKAMRYHGILVAHQDNNHEWYFMRDQKRCALFAHLKDTPSPEVSSNN